MSPRQVAEAFSSHRFDEVHDRLHDDVSWVLPGQDPIVGKPAVVAACTEAAAGFAGLASASFDRFVAVGDDTTAAVDAIGRYEQADGTVSVVSSADVYEFDEQGRLVRITSYAVEL